MKCLFGMAPGGAPAPEGAIPNTTVYHHRGSIWESRSPFALGRRSHYFKLLTAPPDGRRRMDAVALLCLLLARVQDKIDAGVVLHCRANRASSSAAACAVRASGGLRQARRGSARRRGRRQALLGRGRAVVQASRCMRRRPVRVANERRGGGVRCSGKGAGGLQLQAVWALGPKPNV